MPDITLSDLLVLIVEPSPIQRRVIGRALNNNGVDAILESATGALALDRFATESPDLVISSLYLPDMTATDLVQEIRHSSAHPDVPFMLISSETRFRYLNPIRQAGVVGVLPKPFSDAQLRTALAATYDLLDDAAWDIADVETEALQALVVDDSALARRHIARVLQSLGITRIDHAADGMQAIAMIGQHYYDFVVTDYNMPRMDGRQLIEHIRADSSCASLPVLMVTSEADHRRLAAVQQSGVSAICDKPFEPATVRELVRRMVAD